MELFLVFLGGNIGVLCWSVLDVSDDQFFVALFVLYLFGLKMLVYWMIVEVVQFELERNVLLNLVLSFVK